LRSHPSLACLYLLPQTSVLVTRAATTGRRDILPELVYIIVSS
jgi:hypothetical protein